MANPRIFWFFRFSPLSYVRTPLLARSQHDAMGKRGTLNELMKMKPLPPFLQYFAQNKGPRKAVIDHWNNASAAEKLMYKNQYKQNLKAYYDALYDYFKEVPDLSHLSANEQKIFKKVIKAQKIKLEKPIKPLNEYLMYVKDQSKENKNISEIAESWIKLDSNNRKKYKEMANQNLLKYREALKKWEEEMLKQGHNLLVRKKIKEDFEKGKEE